MANQLQLARVGLLGALFLVGGVAPHAIGQQAERRWQFPEPSSSVPRAVSLANDGTLVFSAMDGASTSRSRLLSSYDVDPASSVWESPYFGEARNVRVASSQASTRHAVLQMVPAGSSYRPMVRAFDSTSEDSLWTWPGATAPFLHDTTGIHVSPSGDRVVAAVYQPSLGRTQVVAFDGDTGVVQVETEVTTLGGFRYSALSDDGRTLYLGYSNRSYLVDLENQGASTSVTTFVAALFGHAITSDASRFAVGNLNLVRVFDRNGNGTYSAGLTLILTGPDAVCSKLAISADDRVLAAGFVLSNNRDIRILAWDLAGNGAPLMDTTLVGSGSFTNDIAGLAISGDGSRIAVGTWGDEGGLIPHLMLYQTVNPLPGTPHAPYAQFNLSGSVMGLAMSRDGNWVAVARKSTHANTAAGGGSLELFSAEVPDVQVVGTPSLDGGDIQIKVRNLSGTVFVLYNSSLQNTPLTFSAGTLFVQRQGMMKKALTPQTDGSYATDWSFSSQDGNFVGETLYFQGFSSTPRKLSKDVAAVTVLP